VTPTQRILLGTTSTPQQPVVIVALEEETLETFRHGRRIGSANPDCPLAAEVPAMFEGMIRTTPTVAESGVTESEAVAVVVIIGRRNGARGGASHY
jgi:hypothetical protein